MIRLSKTHIVLSFIALAALRIAIGFHFFDQGHQKIRSGGFDATGFLNAANGPFESMFHSMIADRDGQIRLCYDPEARKEFESDFGDLDENEDNRLDPAEVAADEDLQPRFFADLDDDENQFLDVVEYVDWREKKSQAAFKKQFDDFDLDLDGKLSTSEYFFGRVDLNEDGFLSLNEYHSWRRPESTIRVWSKYKDYIVDQLIQEEKDLVRRRERTKIFLEKVESDSEDYFVNESLYRRDEAAILAIRAVRERGDANRILKKYSDWLFAYLLDYEEDIDFYFRGEKRLEGFARDSQIAKAGTDKKREKVMKSAAKNVGLLRDQVSYIRSERKSNAAEWLTTIDGFWNGFEEELLNMVPLDDDRKQELQIQLPTDSWKINAINKIMPCFDMTVGLLLIIGLFTRTAAVFGGLFLASVLMTQPAIFGEFSEPTTVLYLIEMLAMFTIGATCAGRYAGLDYFVHAAWQKIFPPKDEDYE